MEKGNKKKGALRSYSWIIVIANIILIGLVCVFFGIYTKYYRDSISQQNLTNVKNLNYSSVELADKYFENQNKELRNAVKYISQMQFNMNEILDYLQLSNADSESAYEIIGENYQGFYAQKDAQGAYYEVDYSSKDFGSLHNIVDMALSDESNTFGFIPEFTDGHNATKSFAVYEKVPVTTDGSVSYYILMSLSKSKLFSNLIQFSGDYNNVGSVMMDSNGDYIVGSNFFKSTNFFQYLYVYNKLSLDTKNEIADYVSSTDEGTLYYQNESGQDCVFVYSKLSSGYRYIVTGIPMSDFQSNGINYRLAIVPAIILLIIFAIDMTWMKLLNNRLESSMIHERNANNAKSDFLSRMSHDIRTPLNAVIGFSQIASEEGGLSDSVADSLSKINVSGKYLLGLINDILDMSKIESNKFEIREDLVYGPDFLNSIAEIFKAQAAAKGITLVTDFSQSQTPWIYMDAVRTRQIYSNLINNAIKYSDTETTIRWTIVDTKIAPDRIRMVSVISDEGCGMSEKFMKNIFSPFTQEHNKHSDNESGTGLGLSIVKNLVDLMGGTIEVESELGKGSTFTITMERRLGREKDAKKTESIAEGSIDSLKGKRILLCEDHMLNQQIATKILEKRGIVVECADNGQEGIDMFSASETNYYDCILMDIRMPIMNGLDATKAIRKLDKMDAGTIPIIAMTANAFEDDVKECREAGMNDHIAKPIEPEVVFRTISKYIK